MIYISESNVDSSKLPALNSFKLDLKPYKATSDQTNARLQFCHRILYYGLYHAITGHITVLYDPISQMKILDSTTQFMECFSQVLLEKHCLIDKQAHLEANEAEDEEARLTEIKLERECISKLK